jgi:hypothetical protein
MRLIASILACAVGALAVYTPETADEQASRLAAFQKLVDQVRYNPTPAPNNPDLDCKMRELAYLFALKIQPQRSPLQVMWDAMVSHGVVENGCFQHDGRGWSSFKHPQGAESDVVAV